MLFSNQALPGFFKWTDSSGTEHFTDDISRIPVKYRKKATHLQGYDDDSQVPQSVGQKTGNEKHDTTAAYNHSSDTLLSDTNPSKAGRSAKEKRKDSIENDGSRVATLASMLLKDGQTEREKAYATFSWIRSSIVYDNYSKWQRRYGNSGADQSPEGVLASGRGVCEGIANLFAAVVGRMGLESVVITGRASGARQERHAWNAVKIDGQWGLVDITRHTFLATPQEFLARHFPDNPGWQLLDKPLTYEEWLKR